MEFLSGTGQALVQSVIIIGIGAVFSVFAFKARRSHRGPHYLFCFIIMAAGLGVLISPLPGQWYMVAYIGLVLAIVTWCVAWLPFAIVRELKHLLMRSREETRYHPAVEVFIEDEKPGTSAKFR